MNKFLSIPRLRSLLLLAVIALSIAVLPAFAKAEDRQSDSLPPESSEAGNLGRMIERTADEVHNKIEEVSAAEPTNAQTLEEIKKRIEKTVEEKSNQVKGAMEDLTMERKAVIGEVERVTGEALTIVNKDGRLILPITPEVSFLKADKSIEYSEVAVGNWVSVLGLTDEKGAITPKFIEVYTESLVPNPQIVLLGSVQAIDTKTITITSRYDQTVRSFTLTKNSEFQDSSGEISAASDFIIDMNVLLIGTEITNAEGEKRTELSAVRSLAPLAQQSPSSKTSAQ